MMKYVLMAVVALAIASPSYVTVAHAAKPAKEKAMKAKKEMKAEKKMMKKRHYKKKGKMMKKNSEMLIYND